MIKPVRHKDGTMDLNPAYTEILKFAKLLTEKGIEYSVTRLEDGYRVGVNFGVCEIGDAIEHWGSYGHTKNLIETMGFDVPDVVGSQTAEEALKLVEAAIERRKNENPQS